MSKKGEKRKVGVVIGEIGQGKRVGKGRLQG